MTYFVSYYIPTGAALQGGSCAPEQLQSQAGGDIGVVETLRNPLIPKESDGQTLFTLDIEAVREALYNKADMGAAGNLAGIISPIPGQGAVYAAKAAEARAYSKSSRASDFPLLAAEAEARGVPITEVQSAVLRKASEESLAIAANEAKRITTKLAISKAGNVGEMVRALQGA